MFHAPQAYETQGTVKPGGDQPHAGAPLETRTPDPRLW